MEITNIKIEQLLHHPDNPRTEYQIDDLVESVKEKGILQPLTVVNIAPYRFNVVAGNRRLEAAKAAGLEECPCIIQKMDDKEQASLMLIENMQRKNLTPYEEGKGVQLCLDLGMDEAEISKKTGFSKETIRHRKKLSELDQELLKTKCQDGQISFNDLIKLEKIKDPKAKNAALEKIGTQNFDYAVTVAISGQEHREKVTALRNRLETFAEEMPEDWHDSEYERIRWKVEDDFEIPEDSAEREYAFTENYPGQSYSSFSLWAKRIESDYDEEDDEEDEYTARRREQDERNTKMEALEENFYEMRKTFMQNRDDQFDDNIICWLAYLLMCEDFEQGTKDFPWTDIWQNEPDYDLFMKVNLEPAEIDLKPEYIMDQLMREKGKKYTAPDTAVILVYTALETQNITCYNRFHGNYKPNDKAYERLYRFMTACGYKISDEERKILDGTHELYKKEDDDDE